MYKNTKWKLLFIKIKAKLETLLKLSPLINQQLVEPSLVELKLNGHFWMIFIGLSWVVEEFCPTALYNVASVRWGLKIFVSGLKIFVSAQLHWDRSVEVWTLTGPLQHADIYLFQQICCCLGSLSCFMTLLFRYQMISCWLHSPVRMSTWVYRWCNTTQTLLKQSSSLSLQVVSVHVNIAYCWFVVSWPVKPLKEQKLVTPGEVGTSCSSMLMAEVSAAVSIHVHAILVWKVHVLYCFHTVSMN